MLQLSEEVKELAGKILTSGLLPITADRDATHIALASGYEMDILLTWNCRHIANATISGTAAKTGGGCRLYVAGDVYAGGIAGK